MQTIPLTPTFLPETTCPNSRGLSYNPTTRKLTRLVCGSRSCHYCNKLWSNKWRAILAWNDKYLPTDKALTLTFACWVEKEQISRALEYFWRNLRSYTVREKDKSGNWRDKRVPSDKKGVRGNIYTRKVQPYKHIKPAYFGVVEANQTKSQVHIHFLLRDVEFIPQKIYVFCWQKAQKLAGIPHIAFNVRIEKIKQGHMRYFTKYVTKTLGGKDEIPPKSWRMRGIRYSRNYFRVASAIIALLLKFDYQFKTGNYTVSKPLLNFARGFAQQIDDVSRETYWLIKRLKKRWDYEDDYRRAEKIPNDITGARYDILDDSALAFTDCQHIAQLQTATPVDDCREQLSKWIAETL